MLASCLFLFQLTLNFIFFHVTSICLHVFRLNKMEISQGFKLCCKKCCSYMLPNLSKNVVMHTKVVFLRALLLGCSTWDVETGLRFHFVHEHLPFFRGASCSSRKVPWMCNTGSVIPRSWLFLSLSLSASTSHHIWSMEIMQCSTWERVEQGVAWRAYSRKRRRFTRWSLCRY